MVLHEYQITYFILYKGMTNKFLVKNYSIFYANGETSEYKILKFEKPLC